MTMLQHIRRLACVAAVGIAALAWASLAQADMTLTITDANNPLDTVTVHDLGSGDASYSSLPLSLGNYKINSIQASANYDLNGDGNINTGNANVVNTVLRVTQTGVLNGASDSLIVQVTTSGAASWSVPTGSPLQLSSTLAVSRIDGSNGTAAGSFAAFSSSLVSGFTSVVTAPNAYGAVTTTNSGPATNSLPPFYLNNLLTINTTGLNQVVNLSASTQCISTVPEPSSIVVAGMGALGLIGYGLRRKALGA